MALVERINSDLQEHYAREYLITRKSWFYSVHAIIFFFGIILLIGISNYFPIPIKNRMILGTIFFIIGIFSGVPKKTFIKSTLTLGIIVPIIITIPLIIINKESGLLDTKELISHLFVSLTLTFIFTLSVPFYNFIKGLQQIHVPQVIILNLILTYRYVFLLFNKLTTMLRAEKARRGIARYKFMDRFKMLGTMLGMLLLHSIHQGERVYWAMQARGYSPQGKFPLGKLQINWKKTTYFIISTLLISAAIFMYL